MSSLLSVRVPESLLLPIHVPERLMLGPGPSCLYPRVQRAAGLSILGPLHPEVFQVRNDYVEYDMGLVITV